jgi:hypothetical protein
MPELERTAQPPVENRTNLCRPIWKDGVKGSHNVREFGRVAGLQIEGWAAF